MNKFLHLKRGIAAVTMAATILGSGAGMALAQAPTNATVGSSVAPPVYDLTAKPGETVVKTMNVRNDSSASQTYTTVIHGITSSNEEGGLAFSPSSSADLSGWITVSPSTFTLAPNQAKDVTVTVKVPATASAGGHYATVFAQTSAPASGGAHMNAMVGTSFLLRVSGKVTESADVVEFSTAQARVIPGQPIEFTVRAKNTGNTHIKPQGTIEIFNGDIKVDEIAVNPEGLSILPGAVRKFNVASNKTLPTGNYRAQMTMVYGVGQTLSVPAISFSVVGEMSVATVVAIVLAIFVLILAAALMVNRRPMNKKA